MSKMFGCRPSDIAPLDDSADRLGRFIFDRAIAAFGRGVQVRLDEVASSSNPAIAKTQREWEWSRLMGAGVESAVADPGESTSRHVHVRGQSASDDDDEIVLED